MAPRLRIIAIVPICLLASACFLSGPIGLIGGSASYLLRAQLAEKSENSCNAISVDELLAKARGGTPANEHAAAYMVAVVDLDPTEKPANPNLMTVADLLAQARMIADGGPPRLSGKPIDMDFTIPSAREGSIVGETVERRIASAVKMKRPPGTLLIGTKGDQAAHQRLFTILPQARELARHIRSRCDCPEVRFDPSLPIGIIRLRLRVNPDDA